MPRPSEPPLDRPLENKRLQTIEAAIDRARSAIAQHKGEIDALRARLEESAKNEAQPEDDSRVRAVEELARAQGSRLEALERIAKLDKDDERTDFERERAERFAKIEQRLATVEEGTELARVRMRLERMGLRLEELERKLVSIDESQRGLADAIQKYGEQEQKRNARVERVESLFDELADELRAKRDESPTEGLAARIEALEQLVLRSGTEEATLKKMLAAQESAIESLRGSIAPPGNGSLDDLTRIKGIGPKFARLLNAIGVTTFAQIAGWTEDDIARAAAELGIPPARIHKAGWVEAASRLSR